MVSPPLSLRSGRRASEKRILVMWVASKASIGMPSPGKVSSPLAWSNSPPVKPTSAFSAGEGGLGGSSIVAPPSQAWVSGS